MRSARVQARFRTQRAGERQQGIATILMLLLVGMMLTVMMLSTAAYLRQQQAQIVTNHAQTQAQLKAWTGAELVRQYLQQVLVQGQWSALMAANSTATAPWPLTFSGDGVSEQILASITRLNATTNTVTAQVTGITAQGSPAEARATLELVFTPDGESKAGDLTCTAAPAATTVLHGNVKIGGGGSSFLSGADYADLAIDGDLTVGGGGAAISGCATGDISMTGGGIKDNASLFTENGSITVQSMSVPNNATFWAGRNIEIGNTGSGSYKALKAGAYTAQVVDADGVVRGSTKTGGILLPETTLSTLPWRSGTVVPHASGKLRVTLTDGAEYVVDMGKVNVNAATGMVQGAVAASQKLNALGSMALPDRFSMVAQSVYGGLVSLYDLKTEQLWGYDIKIQGWGGNYQTVWSAGNMQAVTGSIGSLLGGGELWFTQGGCSSPSNCWNVPSFSKPSRIAGKLYLGSNKQSMAGGVSALQVEQGNVSPGLPGVPYCDTRSPEIDVTVYRGQANYVFYFKDVNGVQTPHLSIQHVKNNNGAVVDRQDINLKTVDPVGTALAGLQVRQIGGKGFLSCGNQAHDNLYVDALSCFRSATPASGWNLQGITRFPAGVAWFEGPVRINNVSGTRTGSNALYNSLLATGSITLEGGGHGPLIAPNFVSPVSGLCGGDFYPSNLCRVDSTGDWNLATWKNAEGVEQSGLPVANLAIASNAGLSASSWRGKDQGITGNVLLGTSITTTGNGLSIYGTLNAGMNVGAGMGNLVDLSQGSGLEVDSSGMRPGQGALPSTDCKQTPSIQPSDVRLQWSRFL